MRQVLHKQLAIPASVWLLLTWAVTVGIYWPGLHGPFLFDDKAHIAENKAVAIDDLSPNSLYQAWNSSPFAFPASRPLSMLSFGVNHALTGMDPFWLKLTNLVIHLVNGLLVMLLIRAIARGWSRTRGTPLNESQVTTWALLTGALWLMHPINLTSVLYTVQRMNSQSALFLLGAMLVYMTTRVRMLETNCPFWPGALLCLLLGGIGFLAKENAILLPGLLLILEWLFLDFRAPSRPAALQVRGFFLIFLGVPLLLVAYHTLTHPQWITAGFDSRTFSFEQRLLTQPRALWFYLYNILAPNFTRLGLFHDDFGLSDSLLSPASTLASVAGLIALLAAAWLMRRRAPVVAFGICFFLAGHSLESSVFALEPLFEHRNYLPSVGILSMVAYGLSLLAGRGPWNLLVLILSTALLTVTAANTALRAHDWSSQNAFIVHEVAHHPDSPRANFQAGQRLIVGLGKSRDPTLTYQLARQYMEHVVALNPANSDGLFGLIVLNLYAGRLPEPQWIDELEHRLRDFPYTPENVTTSQFSYLVRWHMQVPKPRLSRAQVLRIFDAVLTNPTLDRYAKAGIHSALRAYYDAVLKEPEEGLEHARQAVAAWPQRGVYHDRLIKILVRLGRIKEARDALERMKGYATTPKMTAETKALEKFIDHATAGAGQS